MASGDGPRHCCAHELFTDWVGKRPDATAVETDHEKLTYHWLDRRANALAQLLRSHGVHRETPVGVYLDRSIDRAVALLGVWKAGGAYLPLNPAYPHDRLKFLIDDSQPGVVVTHPMLAASLPEHPGSTVVLGVDPEFEDADEPPESGCGPDDLAFVVYTSGSTGRPKGILIEHCNIVAHVEGMLHLLGSAKGRRVLQYSPFGYDASMWEYAVSLLSGGTLFIPPPGVLLAGPELAQILRRARITMVLFSPSALLHQPIEDFPDLSTILCGGEAVPERVVSEWANGRRMINAYGPAEATVLATAAECSPGMGSPPIGKPLAHVQVYILDDNGQQVPPGVPGEIYIGGAGVARGYLNLAELSSERFLPDPFATQQNARMYRTGDRGLWRPGGEIAYLGRVDYQIKLHGFRIEPAEVEAALQTHPKVRSCAVRAREDSPGRKQLVAYIDAAGNLPNPVELRQHLKQTLPEYMIPHVFVPVTGFPLTPNGKVDRTALPPPPPGPNVSSRCQAIREIWCEVLGITEVGIDDAFFDAGGNSLLLIRLRTLLEQRLGARISMQSLLEHPTIRELVELIDRDAPHSAPQTDKGTPADSRDADDVAIIGMAGRFPGAPDVSALWDLLQDGREGIRHDLSGGSGEDHVHSAGVLGAPYAEAEFFGYGPGDLATIDPQQFVFLETAWEALEDAGYDPRRYTGAIGVFGGAGTPYRWLEPAASLRHSGAAAEQRQLIGNPWQFLSAHVAHRLGLRGPAVTLQTACSTSLAAVHLAYQSVLSGDSDMALAGGVSLLADEHGYRFEEGGILSPDGHCRPFDSGAQGTVPASGAAIVVLKRLADALADGDTVRAVIRGSAMNNDGAQKAGFAAPGADGQRRAVVRAYRVAGISMDTVGFVQAHGTGTALGDPLEVRALTNAFREDSDRSGYCALGSVKSNLGHLDAAAGVTGLISAVLALEHNTIPATLHFSRPNPGLDLETSPFFVPRSATPWVSDGLTARRAGVSSFGIGGTNVHLVLEEAPAHQTSGACRSSQIVVISAPDPSRLETIAERLSGHLRRHSELSIADVATTLQVGRAHFAHRRAAVCESARPAAEAVEALRSERAISDTACEPAPDVVFMFPGGGVRRSDTGHELYAGETVYREAVDLCASLFEKELGHDIRRLVCASESDREWVDTELMRPSANMAATLTVEIAMAALLRSWGIQPTAVLGHSLGEFAAAHVAGTLSLSDTVKLVALRGRLCDELPPSAMLAVPLPEHEVIPMLGQRLSLAAVNSGRNCVVAGPLDAVADIEESLASQNMKSRRLQISTASHSILVEPVMDRLRQAASAMVRDEARILILSGLTGDWLSRTEIDDPGYWARHLRGTVRFADALTTLLDGHDPVLLEVGPGSTLTNLARAHPATLHNQLICPTDGDGQPGTLSTAVAQLWCKGVAVDWDAFNRHVRHRRISLPTYPFKGQKLRPSARATEAPQPSSDVRETVAQLWCEALGVDKAAPGDDFFRAGGDSLLAVQLRSQIRQRLGIHVPAHWFLAHPTFSALADHVSPALRVTETSAPLLLTLTEGAGPQPPIVLAQAIGGTVYSYRPLANALAPRTVYGLRAYGLEPTERPYITVREIAARNVEELRAHQQEGPYILGGHSSGGLIAHEMARQLLDHGHEVPLVVMIDTVPVEDSQRLNLRSVEDVLAVFETYRTAAPRVWESFRSALADDQSVRDVVVATNDAIRKHVPAVVATDLLYIRAEERDRILNPHPESAWAPLFDGKVEVHTVPGNHMTVIEPPQVGSVAALIQDRLTDIPVVVTSEGADARRGPSAIFPSGLRVEGITLQDVASLARLVGGLDTER